MKRQTLAVLAAAASVLLLAPATRSLAQADPPQSGDTAELADALSNLIVITYACQAIDGPGAYNNAKALVHNVVEQVSDVTAADTFLAETIANAGSACDDTKTCWQSLLDDGVAPTAANGKAACTDYTDRARKKAAELIDRETSNSSSSS